MPGLQALALLMLLPMPCSWLSKRTDISQIIEQRAAVLGSGMGTPGDWETGRSLQSPVPCSDAKVGSRSGATDGSPTLTLLLPPCVPSISFSCLPALDKTLRTMWNGHGGSGKPCLVLEFLSI